MIGLVLVTHGQLAGEFRAALEHVVGPQQACEAISIGPDDDMEERRRDIIESARALHLRDVIVRHCITTTYMSSNQCLDEPTVSPASRAPHHHPDGTTITTIK